ncbi:MAG: protoporphyrinogen oxidase [Acidobacteriia bacterium]|nr:protoporphyrinogen oxidase [Terriglobia bacterium]
MADPQQVVVIGGGISGLACAFRLQQLGSPVTLLEAADSVGGLIGTSTQDGFLFETGPQSFQGTDAMLDLVRELGIEADLCMADPRAPRYILRHGQLQKVPMSPQAIVSSSLLGVGSRWKVVSEAFRKTKPPSEEESVADFVRRKFGHEILEYLVAPFVSGVYAGDPEKLSLRAAFPSLEEWEREYGSILRGAMKSRPPKGTTSGPPRLCSFRGGMATLTRALATHVGQNVRGGVHADAVTRVQTTSGPRYEIRMTQGGRQETVSARALVLATPAYTASHLVAQISSPLAASLSGIAYAAVAVVASGYYTHQLSAELDGFGVLIPRSEKYHTLGTVWNSSLFPERARDGQFTITSFAGGVTDPEIMDKTEKEIAAIVQQENEHILEVTGSPIVSAVWKHPKALPQYNLGHGHVVRAIRDAEREIPGLFFSSNYLQGPSIPKCVEQGFQTAHAVHAHLKGRALAAS